MAKLIYIASILLAISLSLANETSDSSDSSSSDSSTEGKAGEAIKTLLQEKITQKFKEAANEVKGVLVKQLGDSLKNAHEVFNPPKIENKKLAAANAQKAASGKAGAAAIHQNKANRHRKNSGPQGQPQKHPFSIEAKGGAPIPEEAKGLGPIPLEAKGIEGKGIEGKGIEGKGPIEAKQEAKGPGPIIQEAKGPGPQLPPPPPAPCAPQPPCGPPPMDMTCCGPHQYVLSQLQIPPPMPQMPPQMPPPPPPPMMGCAPGPCQQTCGPSCAAQQCCPAKRGKISHVKGSRKSKKTLKKE